MLFRSGLPELPLIALLPGSRRKEIMLNLPPMLETARLLLSHGGRAASAGFVIPAASRESAETVRALLGGQPDRFWVTEGYTYDAVAHSAAAIVASGTATIETALLGTPMAVVYRVTRASWFLGHRLVKVPFYSMVNLVMGREIVPEFIQHRFQPEMVAAAVRELLENGPARDAQRRGLAELTERLHPPAADERAVWLPSPQLRTAHTGLDSEGISSESSGAGFDERAAPMAGAGTASPAPDAIERSVAVAESLLRSRFA